MPAPRINLIPPEIQARRRQRQRVFAIAVGGVAMIGVMVLTYVGQQFRLTAEKQRLEDQLATNAEVRAELAQLVDFERLERELKSKEQLIATLTLNEVRWSVLLADVSLVIPPDTWLTSFAGTISAPARAPADDAALGAITMNGITFTHLDVAKWLIRLTDVEAFTFPYMTLSSKDKIGEIDVVNFNSSVLLTEKAFRRNQPGAERGL